MDARRFAIYAAEAVAVAVCGISLLAAGGWLLARLARRYGTDETAMGTPVQKFGKLSPKEYDAVRAEAASRYAAQSHRKKQSAQIAAGEPVEDRIRVVGGRR